MSPCSTLQEAQPLDLVHLAVPARAGPTAFTARKHLREAIPRVYRSSMTPMWMLHEAAVGALMLAAISLLLYYSLYLTSNYSPVQRRCALGGLAGAVLRGSCARATHLHGCNASCIARALPC